MISQRTKAAEVIPKRGRTGKVASQSFQVLLIALTLAGAPAQAATITVTGAGDDVAVDGVVTLREAMISIDGGTDVDADVVAVGTYGTSDTIEFNISASGLQTINLSSALPPIIKPVLIDAYTEPGASANTLADGEDAVLNVELNGAGVPVGSQGFLISTGGSGTVIRGLAINRFAANGSGNGGHGIFIFGAANCAVTGNFIGTNAAGTARSANGGIGVVASNSLSGGATIGGTTPDKRNVISGNGHGGILIGTANAAGATIQGNFIGTNAAGTAPIANSPSGIGFSGSNGVGNLVGGTSAAARNLISGNSGAGVGVDNGANVVIQGNFIGTDVTGMLPVPNVLVGVGIFGEVAGGSTNNAVGGTAAGAGNTIRFNPKGVIVVHNPASTFSTGNAILGNSISDNDALGIDLNEDGVTANDGGSPPDQDPGDNNLQNFPDLTTAFSSGSGTAITGTLSSAANTQFRVEFFSNPACDPSGNGEGKVFLGFADVTTNGSGLGTINFLSANNVTPGHVVTATATDPSNNTSEFSTCIAAVFGTPVPTATPTPTGPTLDLGTGVGQPGGMACVPVTLAAHGVPIAATSNDIDFDPAQLSISGCSINPAIGSGTPANKQLTMSNLGPGVQRVEVGGNTNLIPDGLLSTCTLPIDQAASVGSHPLSNTPAATDPQGGGVGAGGVPGQVLVTTCTGDCNGNGTVSIGEVTRCINLFLGQPLCDPANPLLSCPVADANHSGGVSIGEVTLCVNRFLGGC